MFFRLALIPTLIFSAIPVAVLFVSAKNIYSSALLVDPRQNIEKWSCEGNVTDMEEWETSKATLERANNVDQHNADIVTDLGRVHELKVASLPVWKPEAKENRRKAISYYEEATTYRPTWALAWVNLAQAKILNQETDEFTFAAIRNGFKFGQWQEIVQQKLIWISLGIWPTLPDDLKETVTTVISASLARNYNVHSIILAAIRFNWQHELKKLMVNDFQFSLLEKYENNPNLRNQTSNQLSEKQAC